MVLLGSSVSEKKMGVSLGCTVLCLARCCCCLGRYTLSDDGNTVSGSRIEFQMPTVLDCDKWP